MGRMVHFLFSRNIDLRPKQGLKQDFFIKFYSIHLEKNYEWESTVRLYMVKVLPDTFITSDKCTDFRVFFLNMLLDNSKRDRLFQTHGKKEYFLNKILYSHVFQTKMSK